MKKLLPLSFLLLFFTACDKDDDKKTEPEPITPVKGCHLSKMEIPGLAAIQFTYNAAGYVIKRDVIIQGSSNTESHEYTYNAQNQLITDKFLENGNLDYQKEFEYSNGLLTKTRTTQGTQVREKQYTYDASSRLTEVKSLNTGQDFKSIYEYDSKGNLTKISSYSFGELSYESIYSNFDDKPNIYATLIGLHIPDDNDDLISLEKLMKNNPGSMKLIFYSQQSGGGVQQIVDAHDTYTYTYGADGLPVSFTETKKSGSSQTIQVSYKCY